jgi:vacuolar-type H+-ATPase subunit I/STV1
MARSAFVLTAIPVFFAGCVGTSGNIALLSSPADDQVLYNAARKLAYEQQRSGALERELRHRNGEVRELNTEVRTLRQRNSELTDALDLALAWRGELMLPASGGPPADAVARALRTELRLERERRSAAEEQLARLRAETSTSPYGEEPAPDPEDDRSPAEIADLRAAKEDIADLQLALEAQRLERERLADELRALQQSATETGARSTEARRNETQVLRSQLARLREEQEAAIDGFSRYLVETERRTAELEQQLQDARAEATALAQAPGGDASTVAVRAENAELRAQLEEEQQRTEALAEKLEVARRVTDLIFKMQAQEEAAPPAP